MKILATLAVLVWTTAAMADDNAIARQYLVARCRTVSKGATAADIAKVLSFLSDDVVVEHPLAAAVVRGRTAVGRGLNSHVADYTGSTDESGIVLLSALDSPGVVVMKTRTTFVVGEGSARQVIKREGVTIVEIRNERITRLIEY